MRRIPARVYRAHIRVVNGALNSELPIEHGVCSSPSAVQELLLQSVTGMP